MSKIEKLLELVEAFSSGKDLSSRIGDLEAKLASKDRAEVKNLLANEGVNESTLLSAVAIKELAGQINVLIHAVGILVSLPYILEPEEKIQSLSLGAGNTGREFDLETDQRVAEFKFITWRGGSESIRQNSLFIDLFSLVEHEAHRQRYLYVVGKEEPMRFLMHRRSISSVLSKNRAVWEEFRSKHGEKHSVVSEYYNAVRHLVRIVDLKDVVPVFTKLCEP